MSDDSIMTVDCGEELSTIRMLSGQEEFSPVLRAMGYKMPHEDNPKMGLLLAHTALSVKLNLAAGVEVGAAEVVDSLVSGHNWAVSDMEWERLWEEATTLLKAAACE